MMSQAAVRDCQQACNGGTLVITKDLQPRSPATLAMHFWVENY